MAEQITIETLAESFAEELARVCGSRLGTDATFAPSEVPPDSGWTIGLPVSGAADGQLQVWFDKSSAAAYTRVIGSNAASDDVISRCLVDLVREAAAAFVAKEAFSSVTFGEPVAARGKAAAGSHGVYVAVPNTASCLFAVGRGGAVAASKAAAPAKKPKAKAVLDVDLPVIVRFGRALMPLR